MKYLEKGKALTMIAAFICFLALTRLVAAQLPEFEYMPPDILKKMIESGEQGFLVVDVQSRDAYNTGHIKGAVNLPWEPDLQSAPNLPKDQLLIVYCNCAHSEDSINMASQLMVKWNYTRIKLLDGGWPGWVRLGYPIEK